MAGRTNGVGAARSEKRHVVGLKKSGSVEVDVGLGGLEMLFGCEFEASNGRHFILFSGVVTRWVGACHWGLYPSLLQTVWSL